MPERWSAWELAEGFHLAHAVDFLIERELPDAAPRTVEALAAQHTLSPTLLGPLLTWVAARTDLVEQRPEGFCRGPGWGPESTAVLHQYLGAYGPPARALADLVACPDEGAALVDRARHARAFAELPGPGVALLPGLLQRLELGAVLDLGCGAGGLLVAMAEADPAFVGWGVDASADMIAAACARRDAVGIEAERVTFSVADVRAPEAAVPRERRDAIETVVAASLLNEFFHGGSGEAERFLRALAGALPGRILVVADYYGVLGHAPVPDPRRATHDWVQLLSAQGVPPPDAEAWQGVYAAAGCQLVHGLQDPRAGSFVHLVRLAEG